LYPKIDGIASLQRFEIIDVTPVPLQKLLGSGGQGTVAMSFANTIDVIKKFKYQKKVKRKHPG